MPVTVSPEALADLVSIRTYLYERNPIAAIALAARLSEAMASLEESPLRGRPGLVAETRELFNAPPYVITYRVTANSVEVVRIWHIAQDRS